MIAYEQLICKQLEHDQCNIVGVCLEPTCKFARAICQACKQQFHKEHAKQLVLFKDFDIQRRISEQQLQQCVQSFLQMKLALEDIIKFISSFSINSSLIVSDLSLKEIQREAEKIIKQKSVQVNYQQQFEKFNADTLQNILKGFKQSILYDQEVEKEVKTEQEMKIQSPKQNIQIRQQRPDSVPNKTQCLQKIKIVESVPQQSQQRVKTQTNEYASTISLKNQILIEQSTIRFSDLRNQKIFADSKMASVMEQGGMILCEPKIQKQFSTKFLFKIKKIHNLKLFNVCLGICSKDIAVQLNFRAKLDQPDHGCYLLDCQGYTYSSINAKDNKIKQGFLFNENQVIQIETMPITKKIVWTNLNTQKQFSMKIDTEQDLYPCAILNYSTIEIVTQP